MTRWQKIDSAAERHSWLRPCGLLLALLLLAALTLQAFPRFHHEVHNDADSPGHQCLVTMLQSGGVELAPAAAAVVATFLAWSVLRFSLPEVLIPTVAFRLLPERAPPVAL